MIGTTVTHIAFTPEVQPFHHLNQPNLLVK